MLNLKKFDLRVIIHDEGNLMSHYLKHILLYIMVLGFGLSACNSPRAKGQKTTAKVDNHFKLTLNGNQLSGVQASASYMVFKGNTDLANVSFRWDSRKDGQVDVFNRMFMINAYGLIAGSYHVVQVAQRPGTGGMAYVIRNNDKGDQQNFGILKNGTLSFSKIDTLNRICSGECTTTLQDNNSDMTVTFTAKWDNLPMVKSQMP